MKCKNCGSEITDKMIFCVVCGEKVKSEEISEAISEKEQAKGRRGKKIVISVISILAVCIAFFAVLHMVIIPNSKYNKALELIDAGNNEEAYAILTELGDFRDAKQLLENFKWVVSSSMSTTRTGRMAIVNYVYDASGNCIQEIFGQPGGDSLTIDYVYDTKGNLIKKVNTGSYLGEDITEYSYDDQGNLIKEVGTDYEGNEYTIEYSHDEQGNLIKKIDSSGDGSVTDYSYDEQGNLLKKVYLYSIDGGDITEYSYNNQGKLIEEIKTFFDGDKNVTKYSYDDQGNLIKEVNTGSYLGEDITEYSYDDQGNCIKEVENDGTIIDYRYDQYGNCIETVRTYSYYEEARDENTYQLIYTAKNKENKSVEEQPNEGNEEEVVDETLISSNSEDLEIKYRVRKAADDAKSQIGAFAIFDNAKQEAIRHKDEGYKVYDMDGSLIYEP